MFSSKSSKRNVGWALVDLIVVIIGVYTAFVIQSSSAAKNDRKEKVKVYSALKMELEEFRVAFPMFASGNSEYLKSIEKEEQTRISGWRFIEPQYGYQIIEYSINIQNTEIIDFETYEELKKLLVGIKQLEHTERLITEVAGQYQDLIPELDPNHVSNLERKANNSPRLRRFKMLLRARVDILRRVSKNSIPVLARLEEELGPELTKQINRKYVVEKIGWVFSEEEAVELIQEHFPDFSADEAREIYKESKEKYEQFKN